MKGRDVVAPTSVEVAVVGAGPVGLTAACLLRQAGVDVVVVDAAGQGANTSRAAVIHPRTLEALDAVDVTRRLLAEGLVVPVFTVRQGEQVLARLDFADLPTRYPFTLMLPQSRTEQVLHARLGELGGQVRWRHVVTGLHTDEAGAELTLTGPGGDRSLVQAQYVIGADGLHSAVRAAAGIAFDGGADEQSFVLADVVLRWPLAREEVQLFFSPHGLLVAAPLPGGHHRIVATVDQAPPAPSLDDVQALLAQRGPRGSHVHQVLWGSRFRVQHRLAATYRHGPVFLAGDAAHVHSPAGGQGMNTGIQDAVDLATTLRDVLRRTTGTRALDGYEARRRPVARGVVTLTDRMTRAATARHPVLRAVRNTALQAAMSAPAVRRAFAMRITELAQ